MKNQANNSIIEIPKCCKDIFNAYMCEGATFTKNDIPICPTTATTTPEDIVTFEEAKSIYKKQLRLKNENFKHNAFVCFYIYDYRFDGPRGIWHDSAYALKVIRHFAGVITPDFSTYQDFPEPIKIYNTYRMRVFGYWLSTKLPSFIQKSVKSFFKGSSNNYNSYSVQRMSNGGYLVKTENPGRVLGSKAIYYKEISSEGKTIRVYKETYDPSGKLVHTKEK